ncbi:MAG: UvrB/UvrC motif-containing protein [Bacteroidales bacterium]|nr:UvrB/UvrC motif-containing protein [Bacteroidales bacterium]
MIKARGSLMGGLPGRKGKKAYIEKTHPDLAADPVIKYFDRPALEKMIDQTRAAMKKAAADLDFLEAARLRDELFALEKQLKATV